MAFDLRSIPSFTRLIRIMLRLAAFLENQWDGWQGSTVGRIAIEGYFMSWSSDIEMPLDGISNLE